MDDEWRLTAKSITKYNPIYRDKDGRYKKNEWIGFFQVGQTINGLPLKIDEYLQVEEKYILAVIAFFNFHDCKKVVIRSLEKQKDLPSQLFDNDELFHSYNSLKEDITIPVENLGIIIKLILREFAWAELFCVESDEIAVRFGYDFYMYVNSNRGLDSFFENVKAIGLFVD